MKNILLVAFFLSLIVLNQSCVTFHGGNYNNAVTLSEGNYKYVKKVSTTEKMTYILFWGGNKKNWLLDDMRENLYKYADLKDNQDLTNFLIATQKKWNPFFTRVRVKMTADVIEWVKSDTLTARSEIIVVENDIIEKQILTVSNSEKKEIIKQSFSCPNNKILTYGKGFTELHLGDVVYSDLHEVYGIVIQVYKEKVVVEFFYNNLVSATKRTMKPEKLNKIECPDSE